jgi:hypothetical protein
VNIGRSGYRLVDRLCSPGVRSFSSLSPRECQDSTLYNITPSLNNTNKSFRLLGNTSVCFFTYRMLHLKRNLNYYTWTPWRTKWRNKRQYIEFLQAYPIVAADALFEIGMAVIAAVLSLDEHLSLTNTSVSWNFVTSRCFSLVSTPRSGYALLLQEKSRLFRCE